MSEWLEGTVERVLWRSDRSGYAVVRISTPEGLVTAVGELGILAERTDVEGQFVALEGRHEDHPSHGRQFRTTGFLDSQPRTLQGLGLYLASSGVKGIGEQLAGRIVAHFGIEAVKVLGHEPERLREVPGIGPTRATALAEAWRRDASGRALMMRLRGLGLSARIVDRVRRVYGDTAFTVVSREPYRLAEEVVGIGFRTADALAQLQGLPPDAPGRVRAAVLHVLEEATGEGHCYLPRDSVRAEVAALGVPTEGLNDAIDALSGVGRLVVEPRDEGDPLHPVPHAEDRLWPPTLWQAEQSVAFELAERVVATGEPTEADRLAVERAEKAVGTDLDPVQRQAVLAALRPGVVVITGGPGTGKTTLLRVLLRVVGERRQTWMLASPTGRAAKRLEEATGRPAMTLHRLLAFDPVTQKFQRGAGDPLEGDGIVVDEASMIDLPLLAALTSALPPPGETPFTIVLVGDVDQLPSVGPGRVLFDLLESGAVPRVRLERVFRQAGNSGILVAAAEVLRGAVPSGGHDDFFFVQRDDGDRARETIVQIVSERLAARGFDPRTQVQVLAPTHKGPLGTEQLNAALQAKLNPDGESFQRGGRSFRVGDRVLCTKNRYDVDVFNGDVGRIAGIEGAKLLVDFDGRQVPWAGEELGLLDLAWAMTVHKSQGSEYPAVVLALHPSHYLLLRRNLLYTAITRASRFLCIVGDPRSLQRAVSQARVEQRFTALAGRLRERLG